MKTIILTAMACVVAYAAVGMLKQTQKSESNYNTQIAKAIKLCN